MYPLKQCIFCCCVTSTRLRVELLLLLIRSTIMMLTLICARDYIDPVSVHYTKNRTNVRTCMDEGVWLSGLRRSLSERNVRGSNPTTGRIRLDATTLEKLLTSGIFSSLMRLSRREPDVKLVFTFYIFISCVMFGSFSTTLMYYHRSQNTTEVKR